MNLLYRIIYAAHCNGTHHKIAVDSLRYLKDDNAKDWRNLFLNNIEAYIEGSKAPDKSFKDFRNHVLHVRDNFWGGAADKSAEWYERLVHNLKLKNWREAAYSAGVLSHYYADALHPFHTAQSDAESDIHRAVEWSISKSYDDLRLQGIAQWPSLVVELPNDKNWVRTLVENNASFANQYYETLITHYDFHKGVVDPVDGFDSHANEAVAKILRFSILSFSLVLDRAFAEAAVTPIKTGLTVKTFLAQLKMPLHWLTRKLADKKERKLVEAMYDELQSTGKVEKNLSKDDKYIQKAYEEEVLSRKPYRAKQKEAHILFAASKSERRKYKRNSTRLKGEQDMITLHPAQTNLSQVRAELEKVLPQNQQLNSATLEAHASKTITSLNKEIREQGNNVTPEQSAQRLTKQAGQRPKRTEKIYLKLSDPVEDGPTIGKKTAQRLAKINIHTVGDFINADPQFVAASIGLRNVDEAEITNWQFQANLMCQVAGVRTMHSKLLVASGIYDPQILASKSESELTSLLQNICLSEKGQKILRNSDLPSTEVIADWIGGAKKYLMQQAA